jgi:hypothetical protein
VKVIDDPLDPNFVTVGLSAGRVAIQLGENASGRYARLTPDQARRLARALLRSADEVERGR